MFWTPESESIYDYDYAYGEEEQELTFLEERNQMSSFPGLFGTSIDN